MFTNTFDELKQEIDLIRESVAKQNGDVKMIDYLCSNVVSHYYRRNKKHISLKGFSWTHLEELKEWLGDDKPPFLGVSFVIPVATKTITVEFKLGMARDENIYVTYKKHSTIDIRIHWISLAGGVYNHNLDYIRPKLMSNPFNVITGSLVENGHSSQAEKFKPFLERGEIKVELYGKEHTSRTYDVNTLYTLDPERVASSFGYTLPEVMRDIRYSLAKHIDNLTVVNVKGLMLINVIFRMRDHDLASFQITRDENGLWETTMGMVPNLFSVLAFYNENNDIYTFPDRHVDHKVKHAPELTELMRTLESFTTTVNGDHKVCLGAETIQVMHDALEDFVSKGNVYLKPMTTVRDLEDKIKTVVHKVHEKDIMLPGIDKVGNIECYFTYLDDHVNSSVVFEFNSLSQCCFTEKGIAATARMGHYIMAISLEFDCEDIDKDVLLSALSVISAKTVAEVIEAKQ